MGGVQGTGDGTGALRVQCREGCESEAKKPGNKTGWVVPGERDLEIVRWSLEQNFLLLDQVAKWFPDGPSNPGVPRRETATPGTLRRREREGNWSLERRVRKLVRHDFLRRSRVFTERAAALVTGAEGHRLLEGLGLTRGLARVDGIDWKNFLHDRVVTDVRWTLEKIHAAQWTAERVLRRELNGKHVPDALVQLAGRSIAIEVELTRKNKSRYRSIFGEYLSWERPHLDLVLYVVPSKDALETIFGSVLPALLADESLWSGRRPDLSRFRFTTLAALGDLRTWWTTNDPAAPTIGGLR
jgi:hypothetical protein